MPLIMALEKHVDTEEIFIDSQDCGVQQFCSKSELQGSGEAGLQREPVGKDAPAETKVMYV